MEYSDPTLGDAVVTYHPGCTEVVIDFDSGTEPALNLRLQARIQVAPMEVA